MVGQSFANIGDVLYIVSIISVVYNLTGSATTVAFIPFAITTAMFVSSILTPILIVKINLKYLILGSQVGKTFILLGLGLFLMPNLNGTNFYLVFPFIIGISLLDGCANPLRQTMIPYYVRSEELLRANGIAETSTQIIQVTVWFLGSTLLIFLSANQLILLVAVLFSVASIMLSLLEKVEHIQDKGKSMWEHLTKGWKTINTTPVLRTVTRIQFLELIADTVWISAIMYVFVDQALQVNETWWGYINGSFFVGVVIGSIYCIRYSTFIEKNLNYFIILSTFSSFIILLGFSLNSLPMVALLLSAFIGISGQLESIPTQTIIQNSVPKENLATVYTSLGTIATGTFGIAALIMGILADLVGIRSVFLIASSLLLLVSFIAFKNKHLFVMNTMKISEKE